MDVERSSLCNCVVNFLLEEKYLLTAFELLHELLDGGRDDQAIRLKQFFSDPTLFPPDQISRFNSLRVVDPQSLLEEKEAAEKKLAISEYELRLANEDILKLKDELQKKSEIIPSQFKESSSEASLDYGSENQQQKRDASFSDLGPLKDKERQDINCAVKEYLLLAGYRLTAMTFYEEAADQNLDKWQNPSACVPDALRHYYYQFLSSTAEAAEEKMALLMQNESLKKAREMIASEKENLLKSKELADGQIVSLTKSLDALQKDLKDKEYLVQDLKQSLEHQRKELNDCRAEITSLKMHIEGSVSGLNLVVNDADQSLEQYKDEIKSLQVEIEKLKKNGATASTSVDYENPEKELMISEENAIEIHEDRSLVSQADSKALEFLDKIVGQSPASQNNNGIYKPAEVLQEPLSSPSDRQNASVSHESMSEQNGKLLCDDSSLLLDSDNHVNEVHTEKIGLETIQILADALPKIVPYVLINHREELLPLMMCAIERHPDGCTRDSLTHTLFNLIKRPDEQQRRIIMDACVTLAKNVGEMRTETELLPQCWEQINHMYEERRLLVAQSCGELAEFVRPEIRDSLILSIIQQLLEDPATVVREAAACNLAMLLPLFPNTDKYFKVEELMFQLVCDPSGVVVESTLKVLVPAVIKWGDRLEHILKVLLSHVLGSAQRCPPLSGVEGSLESSLRVLGERERWNIDVLTRMLMELLPSLHQKAIDSCPSSPFLESSTDNIFSSSLLEEYARGDMEWPVFEWMHMDCFPDLIQLTCLLPQKEDNLRHRITKYLLAVSACFGDSYLTHIMLPVFLTAVGDDAELSFFPSRIQSRVKGLRPRNFMANRLATMGVLPLLLAGILGASRMQEQLAKYLRKILVQVPVKDSQGTKHITEILNAVRFLCTYEDHHSMFFNIIWEMVASSEINLKINAANLLKVIVPYIDAKIASTHVLPALVTLGSDQNLNVKYASVDAFGAVAQHFRNDMIVDKIRVQMDAFLEDGSHEATIAVVRALVVAVPHTTERLRDYLLSKIFQFTTLPVAGSNVMRRRERADAFCEALRALDATDISAASVRDYHLPAIQNLLKDQDALDPAHKEALEIMLKERSGKTFEAFSKVMGAAHIGLASSVTSFFGEGGLLSKKESVESTVESIPSPRMEPPAPPAEDTRLRRIMRGGFTDMLRGRAKGQEETNQS